MGITVSSGAVGPVSAFDWPTLKVEICFDTDPTATYKDWITGSAPTGWWRLGEASGNFADSSGGGHTATATGGGFTYGVTGALSGDTDGAATFGTASYATTTLTPTAPQLAAGFSCEAWVKRASNPAASAAIIGSASGGGGIIFYISTSGVLTFTYHSGGVAKSVIGTVNVCDGNYHHVVGVWDTTQLLVYVDGVLACTPVAVTSAPDAVASGLTLGACNDGTLKIGSASLDEAAFYETPLTPGMVDNHYRSGPVNISPTWVDISTDVLSVDIQRGRQWELNQINSGTCTITLDNKNRDYDPVNTSSPYYPNVLPMRMIRVSATYDSTQYWLYHGLIERWPQAYEGIGWATANLTCVDGYEALSNSSLDNTQPPDGLSGAWVTTLLNMAGWPQATRSIDTGTATQTRAHNGPFQANGTDKALTYLQYVATGEGGLFYIDPAGNAAFQDREYRLTNATSTTSQATFGDESPQSAYINIVPSFDKDRLVNDVRVTLEDGTIVTDHDDTSIRQYFRRTQQISTILKNSTDGTTLAQHLVSLYKQPQERFDQVVIEPFQDATAWVATLGLDISDRVTLIRNPPGGGPAISQDAYIEHIQWAIRPNVQWQITWLTSPVNANAFQLDNATQGKLDSGNTFSF